MAEIVKQSIFQFLRLLPSNSRVLHDSFKYYVDRFNGDNNSDPVTNGEYRFLEKNSDQFNVVFDVGANVGEWSTNFLRYNKNASMHCFEPVPETFEKLKSRRFPEKVVLNNFGLGSKKEQVPIYIFDESDALNSLFQRKGLEKQGIKTPEQKKMIQIETMDDYIAQKGIERIDLVKLDVEGYEYEVFLGMQQTLKQGLVKAIQFEYGGCNIDAKVLLKDIFEFFDGTPYRFFKILPKKLMSYPKYTQLLENFCYQNWILAREDVELK